ncbi:MAG: deoxyribonuclease V [Gammaproteobacteria bacterium]|nr:deoxyribonuclease V [Gammaproteobacteria bacterium]
MPFKLAISHPWDVSIAEAKRIQVELARQVSLEDSFDIPEFVAGVDVGFEDKGKVTRAAIAVLKYPELQLVDKSVIRSKTFFPYVPGYLSFRELPAVIAALERLKTLPDMFLCDGQGIAHPRRLGIACHLGVLTDIPSIGVAKSRLLGTYREPGDLKGDSSALFDGNEQIGVVLRTRAHVKPLFISPGHRISINSAQEWVMNCTTKYRLPETTRHAHHLASG